MTHRSFHSFRCLVVYKRKGTDRSLIRHFFVLPCEPNLMPRKNLSHSFLQLRWVIVVDACCLFQYFMVLRSVKKERERETAQSELLIFRISSFETLNNETNLISFMGILSPQMQLMLHSGRYIHALREKKHPIPIQTLFCSPFLLSQALHNLLTLL